MTLGEQQIREMAVEHFATFGDSRRSRRIIRRQALWATTFTRAQINAFIRSEAAKLDPPS